MREIVTKTYVLLLLATTMSTSVFAQIFDSAWAARMEKISQLKDKYGKVVESSEFDNLFAVKKGGVGDACWEFCDIDGNIITNMRLKQAPKGNYDSFTIVLDSLEYNIVSPFNNGKAHAETSGYYAWIDITGKPLTCFCYNEEGEKVLDENASHNILKWKKIIDQVWTDANNGLSDSYLSFRKEFLPSDIKYLDAEQCNQLVKVICFFSKIEKDTEQVSRIFDAIYEGNKGSLETYQYIVAYYDNLNVFPEKKFTILQFLSENFIRSSFTNFHYGKALISGEGCKKDVQKGIREWEEAMMYFRDDFSEMAKSGLLELWESEGARYDNPVGRLLTEYDDVRKNGKYFWVKKDDKVGLLDSETNILLPIKYDDVVAILDDLFVVSTHMGEQLVTTGGKTLSDNSFEKIELGKFDDGNYFVAVKKDALWGLLNPDGTQATDIVFDDIVLSFFSKPLLYFIEGGEYTLESAFLHGYAIVSQDSKYGIMNDKGELIAKCEYDRMTRSPDDMRTFIGYKGSDKIIIKK